MGGGIKEGSKIDPWDMGKSSPHLLACFKEHGKTGEGTCLVCKTPWILNPEIQKLKLYPDRTLGLLFP